MCFYQQDIADITTGSETHNQIFVCVDILVLAVLEVQLVLHAEGCAVHSSCPPELVCF